jgi:pyrroloquinoline quinone (PQQ) biosynthesis protein C
VQFFLQVREFPRAVSALHARCPTASERIEGAAAITLAAEGQVPGAFGPFARALEKHYGLSREQVAFWDVHAKAGLCTG